MYGMIDESLIQEFDGNEFEINKITKAVDADNSEVISELKYKSDIIHKYYNKEIEAKIKTGSCDTCGHDDLQAAFNGATWGDILVLGLGLGVVPEYIIDNKSPNSVDVVEENAQIISKVTWLDSDINVINGNEFSYTTDKKYDIIICDIFAEPTDVTEDNKDTLLSNYSSNLKAGGRIIIPVTEEIIS